MVRMRKKKFVILIVATVIATLLACAGCLMLYLTVKDVTIVNKAQYKTMKVISDKYAKLYLIQNSIDEKCLWKVDEDKEMEAIYDGLVDSLNDPYSQYMNKSEVKAWKNAINGTFTGIGITFSEKKNGGFPVIEVLDGSPAQKAGIKVGDKIVMVDGKKYNDSDKIKAAMRGDEGTKVTITYQRNGKTHKVSMVRAEVEERTVLSTMLKGKIGYIRIKGFEKGTAKQFKSELAEMENKNVKGIVIDVRNNGGGLTDEGIEIADMLLPEGTITYMQNRDGEKQYYNSDEECTKLPYVLLVNQYTASTSEILAAAVKDNDGGKLVGTKTFGKGIVQGTVQFKDGTALKLTIMQYFSPKGNTIQNKGITPNYKVTLKSTDKKDVQLEKALKLLRQ